MDINQIWAILGLVLGASAGLFAYWWGRKKAAENRGLDERYENIMTNSFASAWKISLAAMYILFAITIFGVELAAVHLLGMLLIIHMIGWAGSTFYYSFKF